MYIAKQLTFNLLTASLILATLSSSVPLSVLAQDAKDKDVTAKDTAKDTDKASASKDEGLKKAKQKNFSNT